MRTRTRRDLPDLDLDTGGVDEALDTAAERSHGVVGTVLRTAVLPVRLAGGLVGLVVVVVVGVVRGIMIPIRLAVALVKKIVQLASDLVYGLWRLVMLVVAAVLGLFRLVFKVLNATVGNIVRLLVRSIGGVLRGLLWVFTLGRISGARKARKQARKEAEGDAVVELEDE